MKKNLPPHSPYAPFIESLENRMLFSTTLPSVSAGHAAPAAIVAAARTAANSTTTSLHVQSGTLGQAVTFTVTVQAPVALGAPTGTVNLVTPHGLVIATLTLTAGTSTDTRFAVSTATYTIAAGGGSASFYYGSYHVTAAYSGSGTLLPSRGSAGFSVRHPKFKTLKHGVRVATVVTGTGTGIASGQTAAMLYTGYLLKHGALFDTTANHSGTPLSFVVNATPEAVVPGFDAGTVGMTVGETRVLEIPSSQAYGTKGSNGVPGNATLVFVITLTAIS